MAAMISYLVIICRAMNETHITLFSPHISFVNGREAVLQIKKVKGTERFFVSSYEHKLLEITFKPTQGSLSSYISALHTRLHHFYLTNSLNIFTECVYFISGEEWQSQDQQRAGGSHNPRKMWLGEAKRQRERTLENLKNSRQ